MSTVIQSLIANNSLLNFFMPDLSKMIVFATVIQAFLKRIDSDYGVFSFTDKSQE